MTSGKRSKKKFFFLYLVNFENPQKKLIKPANFFVISFCTKRKCLHVEPQIKFEITDAEYVQ